jgi:glutathione S-transferase
LTATLYGIPASHPCAAIEAALRLKGVDYRRVDIPPLASKAVMWRKFGHLTVPGVDFGDGERVHGSRAIVRTLEHRAPDPPLLPADGRERRVVEEAERWGDEVLQPLARRLIWATLKRRPSAMMSYTADADLPLPDAAARLSAPLVAAASARLNGAADADVRADLINLDFHLDRADHWIEAGGMGGERPTAADLQVGSGLALLLTLGDIRERVEAHDCARVARRWFPDYPGSTPAGVLPRAWLDARAPSA